jgi:hypothetical protein
LYCDIDEERIYGGFTQVDLENAINKFVSKNYKLLVNPLLNERDDRGQIKYTPETAIAEVKQRLSSYKK